MFRTLKGKISAIYIFLALCVVGVGVVGTVKLVELNGIMGSLISRNYGSISCAVRMINDLQQQNHAISTYINKETESGLNDFYRFDKQFRSDFSQAERNGDDQAEAAILSRVEENHSAFEKEFTRLVQMNSQKGKNASRQDYGTVLLPLVTQMESDLNSIISLNQVALSAGVAKSSKVSMHAVYVLLLITMLAAVGGLVVSRFLVGRIVRPLTEMQKGVARVRAGSMDTKLDIHTEDEIGHLAQEFNEMTERLANYEKNTKGSILVERNKSLAIVKSISDPLVVLDGEYHILLMNPAFEQFFHVDEGAAKGRHFLEVVPNRKFFEIIRQAAGHKGSRFDKILYFQGELDFYYNVVVTKLLGRENELNGFILLMQNVTRLKELERLKTEFMETVSHELKTPLTSILMGASMLQDGSPGQLNGEQKEIIDTIAEDGSRLSGFVNELLEMSRMEAGKSIYHFTACSLRAISENSCRPFETYAASKKVGLLNSIPGNLPQVRADFEKITWVLNNLLSNALKYTSAGDSISLGAAQDGRFVVVWVADTGEGIPQKYIGRIFDRFVQVEGREIEVRGTGLGLSLSKGIINAHNGTISVESELNRGSVFRFTLPVAENGPSEAHSGQPNEKDVPDLPEVSQVLVRKDVSQ